MNCTHILKVCGLTFLFLVTAWDPIYLAGSAETAKPTASSMEPVTCTLSADSHLDPKRYPLWRLVDGVAEDYSSRWASGRRGHHWVLIELVKPIMLDRVVVYGQSDQYALADAELQVRHGDEWQAVGTIKDNQKPRVEFRFEPIEAPGVRLRITRACRHDDTARLMEIEVWHGDRQIRLKTDSAEAAKVILQETPKSLDDARLIASVRARLADPLGRKPRDPRTGRLMQTFYDSVVQWSKVAAESYRPVPHHPAWGFYGDGGNGESSVRGICYAAMVNAFVAEAQPPDRAALPAEGKLRRAEALAAIRYLAQAHKSNGGTCAHGKPWGDQWQSAYWARPFGMAAWMLWDHLDEPEKVAVARVIEHEADRFLRIPPKNSLLGDTGAEENAWNAGLLALACNMLAGHPRAALWDRATKCYMYNTFSVAADARDDSLADDGQPVHNWVTTVNCHPDLTLENHGLVHVGYLKLSQAILLEAASQYLLIGATPPKATFHHADRVFGNLLSCMSWEGAPIYFGGNDWRLVHTEDTDVIIYTMWNLLTGDRRAAHLEDVALEWTRRLQQQWGGQYGVRRDLEHGGICATRMIACYLAHAMLGGGAAPLSEAEFARGISGVRCLPDGKAILHRTPTKFVSFAWKKRYMAVALPENGTWVAWPHMSGYLGRINGCESVQAELTAFHQDIRPDQFNVTGTLKRRKAGVLQDFAFVSLPQDVTIYVERIRLLKRARLTERETGVVGHEFELGANQRTLFGPFGQQVVSGYGPKNAEVREWEANWLNVGNRIGYVVRRGHRRPNVIRYHDLSRDSGILQEWYSLVGDKDTRRLAAEGDWACVVAFLNQSAEDTASWADADRVKFEVAGDEATCRIAEHTIRVDFATCQTSVP
jgi:hypothetical protein